MMETIDSKKKKLSLQDILVRAIHNQKSMLTIPFDHALLQMVAELQMPNSEALQFGNTVFVTHYSPESPVCVMYALNVDTAKNYIDNGELYIKYLIKKGIKTMVTCYTTESFGVPLKKIDKMRLGKLTIEHTKDNKFLAVVEFPQNQSRQQNV